MENGSRNGFSVYSYMLASGVQGAGDVLQRLFPVQGHEKQQKAIPNDRFTVDDKAV